MNDGMIKDSMRIWKWIFLLSSIVMAAYVVSTYAS